LPLEHQRDLIEVIHVYCGNNGSVELGGTAACAVNYGASFVADLQASAQASASVSVSVEASADVSGSASGG
jgi:hypothetical protein